MIEREVKLDADTGMVMPRFDDVWPGVEVGDTTELRLDAVYYDTPTLSLARAGCTLRARTGEPGPIWTLKLPTESDGDDIARHELTFDEPLGPVPADVRVATRAHVRSQTLDPVVRLHTHRTEFALSMDGNEQLKVCDDVVTVEGGGSAIGEFREIELEFASDEPDRELVEKTIAVFRDAGCREVKDPIAKAIRALGIRAFDPPDLVVAPIDKHATVEAMIRYVIAKSVEQIIDHHAGVWIGSDEEELHQFRVATRRLRSDLRTFEPLLDKHWTTFISGELRWLGGEVGRARDADVLAMRLRGHIERLPPEDAKSVDRLLVRINDTIHEARGHAVAALSSDRYVALLDVLVEAARAPRLAAEPPGLADSEARPVVPDLVKRPWNQLERSVKALGPYSPDAAYHAARIKAKRARYAIEAVKPLFGSDARRFASAVADVQSVLGDHQDTAVAEAWLRDAAKALPSTRLVAGQLIVLERTDRTRARKQFGKAWKQASSRKLRTWLK